MKFRKKPVVIEAVQLSCTRGKHGNQIIEWGLIEELFKPHVTAIGNNVNGAFECICFNIRTLEGVVHASPGDWIIRGVKGELYPCKPDIFAMT